jgi:hypothetical protein
VEAVETRPAPSTIKELQVFLGLVNFYQRFLPGVAMVLRPLTDGLNSNRSANDRFAWSLKMEANCEGAKAALSRATWLGHLNPTAQLALYVDASASHIRETLQQRLKGHRAWQPLGFFSCKLEAAQAKWNAFDQELFACMESIWHFQFNWKASHSPYTWTTSPQ